MHEFESGYGKHIIKWRWLIIIASLIFVFLAASGGKNLAFSANYRIFFSDDNPQLLAFEALEKTYTKNDNVMFVLSPKDGNAFSPETLHAVEVLTEKAWQLPYSIRVDSLSNFQHTEAEEDDLIVGNLIEGAESYSADQLQRTKEIALNEPLLLRRLISDSGHVTAVNATIQLPGINEITEVPEVVAFAREIAAEMRAEFPDIELRLTGMVLMNNAFPESTIGDMKKLVPISFAIMLLFLAFFLKGVSSTFGIFLVILFSIVAAMGLGGHLGLPLSPPSASAPTIILTVAIANAVHVLVTFLHEMRHGKSKNDALVESLRVNLAPVFLASITTAIGFLTLNFSDVPPFRDLGNFVAMGVVVSFILSITFLPALMSLLPVTVKPVVDGDNTIMDKFGDFVVAKRRPLLWGMSAFIILLASFLPQNELNDVFVKYFDKTVEFRQNADYTTENLTGLYTADYSLESGEPGGISNPQYLQEIDAFAEWFRQQPETLHVNVYTDTIKRLNKNMHGDDPAWKKIPDNRELSAQYLLLYEMSLPYGLDLNNQINVDKSSTRMTASIKTISSNEVIALGNRANEWLEQNTTLITEAESSGPTVMFAHIGKRNILSMLTGTTVALILISIILIFALRSFKIGVISMVPNLVPAAMGFGVWGLIVGEVGMALAVVSTMTLGIVVDDTVHFLSKYLRARREHGYDSQQAVKYAFSTVGRAPRNHHCCISCRLYGVSVIQLQIKRRHGAAYCDCHCPGITR